MRTTIRIDDRLLVEAKARAARSGSTLAALIEDALREALARRDQQAPGRAPELPTMPGGRLLPGVDVDDSAALLELMEGLER